jgi:HAD superfamily hydrolase (TIGR01549 family)
MLDQKYFLSFNAYLFDLDNTIYDENVYLFEVYRKIALTISKKTSLNHLSILEDIKLQYLNLGREKLFDSLIIKYNLQENILNDFLNTQRTLRFEDKMELFPQIEKLLFCLKKLNKIVLIVTNGNPKQQKNKIDQINWHGLDSYIRSIYADEIEKKPSILLFQHIKAMYNIEESKTLIIGDSEIDMLFAKNSNIEFLNVSEIL